MRRHASASTWMASRLGRWKRILTIRLLEVKLELPLVIGRLDIGVSRARSLRYFISTRPPIRAITLGIEMCFLQPRDHDRQWCGRGALPARARSGRGTLRAH